MRRSECEKISVKPSNRLPGQPLANPRTAKLSQSRRHPAQSESDLKTSIEKDLSLDQSHLQFLANMNHELRTPLNGLMGAAELLSLTELDAEQKRYVEIFRSANHQLLNLVEDILDFSKMMSGSFQLQKNHFDIRQIIHDCHDHFLPFAERKSLAFKAVIADDLPCWLYGDAKRFSQILYHLVANAIKFTHEGEVSLAIACEDDDVILTVSDSGIGISKDIQKSIFEAFYQEDMSHTRRYGGVGMGLAIVRFLAKAMGGELKLVSEPDAGAAFTIRFPFIVASARNDPPEALVVGREPRILLVEDNEVNQAVVFLLFSKRGIHVDIAQDGLEAVNFHRKSPYDLIFMDLNMPVMGGIEATRQIRDFDADVQIIALTADFSPADKERGLAAGINDFLSKPLNYSSLERVLDRARNRLKS